MARTIPERLLRALKPIDRPGSFCASGGGPAPLPGLEVTGLGPVGLPLTARQANEMKKHCRPAPYGKGEKTVIDTRVRRVWQLDPDRFSLTNPDWQQFLSETVRAVQRELGLEGQKLQSHLYNLLLYEPGSFFLPHRDGEKLDRMVATRPPPAADRLTLERFSDETSPAVWKLSAHEDHDRRRAGRSDGGVARLPGGAGSGRHSPGGRDVPRRSPP